MSKPIIADNKPVKVLLSKGQEYHFCTCGRSKSQPFCDGSHNGTGFAPVKYVADEKVMVAFCGCKQSCHQPYCDDAHIAIKVEHEEIDESKKKRII